MKEVREVVTLGLQARQKAGIPVRQPLNKLNITGYELKEVFFDIVKDELNIKGIKHILGETRSIEIDTHMTEDLRFEGQYRELIRAIQDERKNKGLNPNDVVTLVISTNVNGQKLINKFKTELIKTVSAKEIQIKENEGTEIKIGEYVFVVSLV
ncbi:MAG: DUF5915 domain-containing protein [Candidatus Nomurabacteria bacterium]|nr:DUF5915 domain-containing protein [Candidatus Nomurabacteria bacterium]